MIFFCASKPLRLTFFGETYELAPLTLPEVNPDHILAAPNGLALSILRRYPQALQLADFDASKLPGFPLRLETSPEKLPAGSSLLMLRDAGIGDAITMTPVITHLKAQYQSLDLKLATLKDRHELLNHLDCELLPLPLRLSQLLGRAAYYVDFHDPKGICENVEMIDFNFDSLNIAPASIPAAAKQPSINPALTGDQRILSETEKLTGDRSPHILCAPGASDILRELPLETLRPIFAENPGAAFLVAGKFEQQMPKNVATIDTSSSLAAFASAIAACDAIITTDSAACHLAAALKKPTLAIFGPVPSSIRSGYYPSVISLDAEYRGQTCHSPCFIHGHLDRKAAIPIGANQVTDLKAGVQISTRSGQTFSYDPSKGCPEMNALNTSDSPCLHAIEETRIREAFERLMKLVQPK